MTTAASPFTPLESLLLFQSILKFGIDGTAFAHISATLRGNAFVQSDTSYNADRLSAESLQQLFLHLLRDELPGPKAGPIPTSAPAAPFAATAAPAGGPSPPSRKRKLSGPPLPTLNDARAYADQLPDLVERLYARYRDHIVAAIRDDERRFEKLQTEIRLLEQQAQADDQRASQPLPKPGDQRSLAPGASSGIAAAAAPAAQPRPPSGKPQNGPAPQPPPAQARPLAGPAGQTVQVGQTILARPAEAARTYPPAPRQPSTAAAVLPSQHPQAAASRAPLLPPAAAAAPTAVTTAATTAFSPAQQPRQTAAPQARPAPVLPQQLPLPAGTPAARPELAAATPTRPTAAATPSQPPALPQPPHSMSTPTAGPASAGGHPPLPWKGTPGRPSQPPMAPATPASAFTSSSPHQLASAQPHLLPKQLGPPATPSGKALQPRPATQPATAQPRPVGPVSPAGAGVGAVLTAASPARQPLVQPAAAALPPAEARAGAPVSGLGAGPLPFAAASVAANTSQLPSQAAPPAPGETVVPVSSQPPMATVGAAVPSIPTREGSPFVSRPHLSDCVQTPASSTPTPVQSPGHLPLTPAQTHGSGFIPRGSGTRWKPSEPTPSTPKPDVGGIASPAYEPLSPVIDASSRFDARNQRPPAKKHQLSRSTQRHEVSSGRPRGRPPRHARPLADAAATENGDPKIKNEASTPNALGDMSTMTVYAEMDESAAGSPPGGTAARLKRKREDSIEFPSPGRPRQASSQSTVRRRAAIPPVPPSHVLWMRGFPKISASALDQISSHRNANMFAHKIRDRDAPGYGSIVRHPVDLKMIRMAIMQGNKAATAAAAALAESETAAAAAGLGGSSVWLPISEDLVPPRGIVNSSQLECELVHMFANAIMYNPDSHRGPGPAFMESEGGEEEGGENSARYKVDEDAVVNDTREMYIEVEKLLTEMRSAEKQRGVLPPPPGAKGLGPAGDDGGADGGADGGDDGDADADADANTEAEDDGDDRDKDGHDGGDPGSDDGGDSDETDGEDTGSQKRRRIARGQ